MLACMRTVVVVVLVFSAACSSDLVLPDDVTPGDIAGNSGTEWWLGMPPESVNDDRVLDVRLTRYDGAFASVDTLDICRTACRHIGYAGNNVIALDHDGQGIQLVDAAGAITQLAFPLEEAEQDGPWLLAGRRDTLYAAAGTRVFQRDGDAWLELVALDAPVFAIDVEDNGVLVAMRDIGDVRLPATLVGDEWIAHDDDIEDGALVAFEPDGSFVSSQSITPPAADAFVPLRMFSSGLLAARLVATTLDAVIVSPDGVTTTWASLGSADDVNPLSFRATVFDDGTVGVLYPGAPREEGVGPKTVLHVGTLP